jgi:hypothetical protein
MKLLHNFFQKNETDHRLSVGIITPYLGQVAASGQSDVMGRFREIKMESRWYL